MMEAMWRDEAPPVKRERRLFAAGMMGGPFHSLRSPGTTYPAMAGLFPGISVFNLIKSPSVLILRSLQGRRLEGGSREH